MVVLFGDIKKDRDSILAQVPVDYVHMGSLSNVSVIAELYAAADVTVVPSHYECLPTTVIEAMACGCPVVSFDNSGARDIIDHKTNGYLAAYKDTEDLARGIYWVLNEADYEMLSQNALAKVEQTYNESSVVEQYQRLYDRIAGH